jgi:hypothetical protein
VPRRRDPDAERTHLLTGRRAPLPALAAAVAAALALVPAAGPIRDVDVFWRVRLGSLVLSTHAVPSREPWNFPVLGRPLAPTGWLADVTLAVAHGIGGWTGVVVWRLLASALLLALLARLVPPRTPGNALVFAITALAVAPSFDERPQLLSFCLLAAVLPSLLGDRLPHPALAGLLGWVWAMLHGLWVIWPALLLLRVLGTRHRWRAVLGAAAAVAGAAITPVGPRLLATPFVYSRNAHDLLEWQPLAPWRTVLLPVFLLAAVAAAGWLRARRVAAFEAVWVGAAVAAAMYAGRNLTPALLMLAPVAAAHLRLPEVRRTVPVAAFGVVGAVALGLVVATAVASRDFDEGIPLRLVADLRHEPGEVRVLNEYDAGGPVTGLGGPRVHAAVDGRLDPYPDGWVHHYIETMRARGDWPALVAELRPTHALVVEKDPVAQGLLARGWRPLDREGVYVLLRAP